MDPIKTAQNLRKNQTEAEKRIWKNLRNRGLGQYKFRRQHPIPPYIADFFCEEKNLIVEIDGGQHTEEADQKRSDFLTAQGYKIIRFWNNDVLKNIEGVLETILTELNKTPHPSSLIARTPSPLGRGKRSAAEQGEGKISRVCLGKIVGVHGIKGLVKIMPFGEDVTLLEKLPVFTGETGDQKIALTLKHQQGAHIVAAVENISDRTGAEKLKGTELWINKSDLPEIIEPDTYYYADLIGLPVIDETGEQIGTLKNILNYGSADLFDITLKTGQSVLLPFTENYVRGIEPEANIQVQAIKDFMEL